MSAKQKGGMTMKRSFIVTLVALFISFAFIASLVNVAEAQRKTRDLVFEEDEEETPSAKAKPGAAKNEKVAVKTAILLLRDGEESIVLPSYKFKSGDKVKFVYTTNIDCYVYSMSQGSSGDYSMLFPHPRAGLDNYVKRNETYTIPVKGKFRFDDKKGVEKILLVLATEKVPELEEVVKSQKAVASNSSVKSVEKKQETKRKSRDLVFEEDDDEDSGVSTKSQTSSNTKEPLVVYYELVHN